MGKIPAEIITRDGIERQMYMIWNNTSDRMENDHRFDSWDTAEQWINLSTNPALETFFSGEFDITGEQLDAFLFQYFKTRGDISKIPDIAPKVPRSK